MKKLCVITLLLLVPAALLAEDSRPVRAEDGTFIIDGEGDWLQVAEGVWQRQQPDGTIVHHTEGTAGREWLLEMTKGQTHELFEFYLKSPTPEAESQLTRHMEFADALESSLYETPSFGNEPGILTKASSECSATVVCEDYTTRYCEASGSLASCSAVDPDCPTEGRVQCTNGITTTKKYCNDCPPPLTAKLEPCTLEYPPRTYEVTGRASGGKTPYTPYWKWAGGPWYPGYPTGNGPWTEQFTNAGPFTVYFKVKDSNGDFSNTEHRPCGSAF